MISLSITHLFRGPNVWAACPVAEARISASGAIADLAKVAPELKPTGDIPSLIGQLACILQTRAGMPVSFFQTQTDGDKTLVAVACVYVNVGQAALEGAARILQNPDAWADALQRLVDLEFEERFPYSTAVIQQAALRRNIPVTKLHPEYGRFLRLGQGSKQHRAQASEPDTVNAVARTTSTDKYFAKKLMHDVGVPVPQGKLVKTLDDAQTAATDLGFPLVLKPLDSDLQIGVTLDVREHAGVEKAFHRAQEHSTWVLVEPFAPGVEHRVLVVGDEIAAVTRVDPPQVRGDGVHTIAQLVELVNQDPRRGDQEAGSPLAKLKLDDEAIGVLANQGLSITTIPKAGEKVLVRRNPPYFKNGGNLVDLTDVIHPTIAAQAIAAARAVQLPVAGLDVVALDITQPLEEQRGVIVEINAGPGLWLHLAPWADSPRPVGDAIVRSLFPPGDEGRIPVIALVGDDGGAVRAALELGVREWSKRLGLISTREICVNGRAWNREGACIRDRAELLFQNPMVDVALIEMTAQELMEQGFANDRCDLALVLDAKPGPHHRVLRNALGDKGLWAGRSTAIVPQDLPAARSILLGVDIKAALGNVLRSILNCP